MYSPSGSGTIDAPSYGDSREASLRKQIRSDVIPEIPRDCYRTTSDFLPLKHDTSLSTIVARLLPLTDGSLRTNAVYILECFQNRDAGNVGAIRGASPRSISRWQDAKSARRILYVGATRDSVVARLDEHINSPGDEGAYFTGIYPPVRVLSVDWYHSPKDAKVAKRVTADLLQEAFPDDYVGY